MLIEPTYRKLSLFTCPQNNLKWVTIWKWGHLVHLVNKLILHRLLHKHTFWSHLCSDMKLSTNSWSRCWCFLSRLISSGFYMVSNMATFPIGICSGKYMSKNILCTLYDHQFSWERESSTLIFAKYVFFKGTTYCWKGLLQNKKHFQTIKWL